MARGLVIVLICLVYNICIARSCQPPDCDHPDCGSCGNACCALEFLFPLGPDTAFKTLVTDLQNGGADSLYTYVGSSDLRPYNLTSGAMYMIQAIHTTLVMRYNDTLDFVVVSTSSSPPLFSVVRIFSVSQIQGALCDAGQNYKNIVGFIKGLGVEYVQRTVFGCAITFG
eukprot:Em0023g31a